MDDKRQRILVAARARFRHYGIPKTTMQEIAQDAGVAVGTMTAEQKAMVRKTLEAYASLMAPALAAERMGRLEKAGFDQIRFAWAGGIERGDPHYYRLQGPTFLVEFDNTQNGANHTHTVWRDFKGDFGRDLLAEHYQKAH